MNRTDVHILLRAAQLAFCAAFVFTFVAAVMPPRHAPQLFPWDKAEHFAAFYTLALLAMAAFPRRSLLAIAVLLSAFGGLIELVQALPIVGRDCDVRDWVADTIAILAALAPIGAARWRALFATPPTG
ncbi:MAG TPA: VanZ family protein [Rhizomicrobium sp.]|jgi:VanZ family protein|nr:VanZ family protein [Rhizomicrobium sp.]